MFKKITGAFKKAIPAVVNIIPDGILLNSLGFIHKKLIGKIPEEKKKKMLQHSGKFIRILVSEAIEAGARGMTSGLKQDPDKRF